MKTGVHHIGKWKLMNNVFSGFKKDLQEIQKKTLMQIGLEAEKLAKKHITSQDLGWTALRERYKKRKIAQGKSEKILIRTSSYLQSITSWVMPPYAYAGVKKTAKNKDGESIADIAKTLEYGSVKMNIPPRPLWSVVLTETKQFAINDDTLAKVANKHYAEKYNIKDTKNLAK